MVLVCLSLSVYLTGKYNTNTTTDTDTTSLQNGTLNLNNWDRQSQPSIDLSGEWKFFPDQLITPQQLKQAAPAATTLYVPASWNGAIEQKPFPEQGHGTGTYWLTIQTPDHLKQPISLAINRSCSNASVFFYPANTIIQNPTSLIGNVSKSASTSTAYAGSRIIPLPKINPGIYNLLIQVSNFDFISGGLCGKIKLGNSATLIQQTNKTNIEQSMLIAMIAMAALYSLAIFIQNHDRHRPMWLMFTCLSAAVFFLSTSGLLEQLIHSSESWIYELRIRLSFAAIGWAATSILMFYAHNFSGYINHSWLTINLLASTLLTTVIAFTPASIISAAALFFIVYWAIQLTSGLWILARAVHDRQPYSLAMIIAIAPLLFIIPINLQQQLTLNEIPVSSLYCMVFFVFIESQIIGHKISTSFQISDKLSKNLKNEVDIQTSVLNKKNQALEKAQKDLKKANEALRKLSITDGLTRLNNRLFFEKEFRKEWRRSARQRTQISVLMIDADHFKNLNDSAGHLAGDQALQALAKTLHQHFKRAGELVARYGGEEFVVMLPQTGQRKALAAAEGARHAIEKLEIIHNNQSFRITISIGISTTIPNHELSPDHLLEAADAALYQAKHSGRNRTASIPLLHNSVSTNIKRSIR